MHFKIGDSPSNLSLRLGFKCHEYPLNVIIKIHSHLIQPCNNPSYDSYDLTLTASVALMHTFPVAEASGGDESCEIDAVMIDEEFEKTLFHKSLKSSILRSGYLSTILAAFDRSFFAVIRIEWSFPENHTKGEHHGGKVKGSMGPVFQYVSMIFSLKLQGQYDVIEKRLGYYRA